MEGGWKSFVSRFLAPPLFKDSSKLEQSKQWGGSWNVLFKGTYCLNLDPRPFHCVKPTFKRHDSRTGQWQRNVLPYWATSGINPPDLKSSKPLLKHLGTTCNLWDNSKKRFRVYDWVQVQNRGSIESFYKSMLQFKARSTLRPFVSIKSASNSR
jgi:hypothetical protein